MAKHKHKWQEIIIRNCTCDPAKISYEKYCRRCGKIKFDPDEYFKNAFTFENDGYRKVTEEELQKKYPCVRTVDVTDSSFSYSLMPKDIMQMLDKEKKDGTKNR